MNFAQSVKNEILKKQFKDKCCKKAFIAGILRGNGGIFNDGKGFGLVFSLKDETTLSVVSEYFLSVYGYELRNISVYEDSLNKSDVFNVTVKGEQADEILFDLGIFVKNESDYGVNLKFYGDITQKPCCLRAFFKGLFISRGRCTVPNTSQSKKTRYHLEFEFSHSVPAIDTAEILGKNGVSSGIVRRKNAYVVYLKSGEEMKNFFAFLGLYESVLTLTDLMVSGEMTNMINRRKNCDIGNVVRQMDAAEKQIEAINFIINGAGLCVLKKPELIDAAKMRLDFPDESVNELAEKLNLSKSCLNHRFRKILSVAEGLKTSKNTKD